MGSSSDRWVASFILPWWYSSVVTGEPGRLRSSSCPCVPALAGMRFAVYNPLSLCAQGRFLDVSRELRQVDLICLPGTKLRRTANSQGPYSAFRTLHHTAINWGYGRGKHTNRAAGCTILVGKRLQRAQLHITSPPGPIQGRGGAVQVKIGATAIKAVVAYVPPRPRVQQHVHTWRSTVQQVLSWVQSEVQDCPVRVTPLIGMDLNDGAVCEDFAAECMGECGTSALGPASHMLHQLLVEEGMSVIGSYWPAGDTYFGAMGHSSAIDHLVAPQSLTMQVLGCCVWKRAGKKTSAHSGQ